MDVVRSELHTMYSRGPSPYPWTTPALSGRSDDIWPANRVEWWRLCKNSTSRFYAICCQGVQVVPVCLRGMSGGRRKRFSHKRVIKWQQDLLRWAYQWHVVNWLKTKAVVVEKLKMCDVTCSWPVTTFTPFQTPSSRAWRTLCHGRRHGPTVKILRLTNFSRPVGPTLILLYTQVCDYFTPMFLLLEIKVFWA